MAVGAQTGCSGADTRLMTGAVAEIALISRLHVDAALVFHKGPMEGQGLCKFNRFSALLAQQRMTGMADSLLIGSEKLRVFGCMTFMTEIAVLQYRPVMHNGIADELCFMAALPEAQAKRRGFFPLLDGDVMAGLAFILGPGLVGAKHIGGGPQDIAYRGKLRNSQAVLEFAVAGNAQVRAAAQAEKRRLTGAQRINAFFNDTFCMRVMAGHAVYGCFPQWKNSSGMAVVLQALFHTSRQCHKVVSPGGMTFFLLLVTSYAEQVAFLLQRRILYFSC